MSTLINQLQQIVGSAHVLVGEDVLSRHSTYCSDAYDAALLVRPKTTDEVAAIAALAKKEGANLVPHGGMTGLVEGTASTSGDIIISFERMSQILRVDADQMVLIAEAGATLQSVIEAAADVGMMPGVDIPSRGSATLGGMTATNAGGVRVLRYGMMRENILGLEAVLPDGTVISSLNTLMKNNAGFDLKQLFIGSEGRLGLVTAVSIKLHPKPAKEETALVAAKSFSDLVALLGEARSALGADLLSFETMWPEYYQLTTSQPGFGAPPLSADYGMYAVIEVASGTADGPSLLEPFLETAFETDLIVDAVFANSMAEQQRIWRAREDSDAVETAYDANLSYDIGFELKDMDAFAQQLGKDLAEKWPDMTIFFFGHMGDGNLHIMLGLQADMVKERHSIDAVVYECAGRFNNSTLSAEHGIGLEKKPFLSASRTSEEIALMQRLIDVFGGGINNGKVV